MIVVSDASPLIVLANIGHLNLLPTLYREIVIPPAVERELSGFNHPKSIDFIPLPGWLHVHEPTGILTRPGLDPGEAMAIQLAIERNADLLLIDEKAGRRVARQMHVPIVGTVGILEDAAGQGLIDLESSFERLKSCRFRITTQFLDNRLAAFRSRKTST